MTTTNLKNCIDLSRQILADRATAKLSALESELAELRAGRIDADVWAAITEFRDWVNPGISSSQFASLHGYVGTEVSCGTIFERYSKLFARIPAEKPAQPAEQQSIKVCGRPNANHTAECALTDGHAGDHWGLGGKVWPQIDSSAIVEPAEQPRYGDKGGTFDRRVVEAWVRDTELDIDAEDIDALVARLEIERLPVVLKRNVPGSIHDIAAERERQAHEERWTTDHDDGQIHGELSTAAACYAMNRVPVCHDIKWPWETLWDKRTKHGRRKSLVLAGALIAAEIDRLDRARHHNKPYQLVPITAADVKPQSAPCEAFEAKTKFPAARELLKRYKGTPAITDELLAAAVAELSAWATSREQAREVGK